VNGVGVVLETPVPDGFGVVPLLLGVGGDAGVLPLREAQGTFTKFAQVKRVVFME
jgi:hypothetical protein